jgi:hypothetical protein
MATQDEEAEQAAVVAQAQTLLMPDQAAPVAVMAAAAVAAGLPQTTLAIPALEEMAHLATFWLSPTPNETHRSHSKRLHRQRLVGQG